MLARCGVKISGLTDGHVSRDNRLSLDGAGGTLFAVFHMEPSQQLTGQQQQAGGIGGVGSKHGAYGWERHATEPGAYQYSRAGQQQGNPSTAGTTAPTAPTGANAGYGSSGVSSQQQGYSGSSSSGVRQM